jgi:hypothetical protein
MTRIVSRAAGMLLMIALLLVSGTSTATAAAVGTGVARPSAVRLQASGSFTASVDFASLIPTPVGKRSCRFEVEGKLEFSGSLVGTADGVTTALIHAPCVEALSKPPGTFADVFRFRGLFTGTVAGVLVVDADLSYAGVTRAGGSIDANIKLRAVSAQARLRTTNAVLGKGGSYHGVVITRR